MKVVFVGSQLSWRDESGSRRRALTGDEFLVGDSIPEEVFAQYAHKFRLVGVPESKPVMRDRSVSPARIKHTGYGWYEVVGVDGKYRKEEALALLGDGDA